MGSGVFLKGIFAFLKSCQLLSPGLGLAFSFGISIKKVWASNGLFIFFFFNIFFFILLLFFFYKGMPIIFILKKKKIEIFILIQNYIVIKLKMIIINQN